MDGYSGQLSPGARWSLLRPVISIWLFTGRPFDDEAPHHRFRPWDADLRVTLSPHLEIHVLELSKSRLPEGLDDEARWMYFFKEAKNWDALPADLVSPSLRLAMSVLQRFSEQERDLDRYRARRDFLRTEATFQEELDEIQKERDEVQKERDEALALAERERGEKERESAEKERLRGRLRALGVDPDM